MKFRGRLVVDWRGHPIKNCRRFPIFISAQVEGWRVEALMRLDPRVTLEDIVARMILTRGELNHKNPMTLVVSWVRRRRRKFRLFNRCTLWAASVPENEVAFAQLLQDELTPAMLAANSTRDLTPLTGEEFVSLENIGKPPIRTGPKTSISRDERGYAAYYFKSEDSYTIDFPEWLFYTRSVRASTWLMVRRTSDDSPLRGLPRQRLNDSQAMQSQFMYQPNKRKRDDSSDDDNPAR